MPKQQTSNQEDFKPRISKSSAMLMIWTAFFFDFLQSLLNLIPYAGQILGTAIVLISSATFYLWLRFHRVRFFESFIGKSLKNRIMKAFVPVIEIFSFGIAPGITIYIAMTILQVRFDDKLVEKGIITEEQLNLLDDKVKNIGKKHGFDSPEFKQELSKSLTSVGS